LAVTGIASKGYLRDKLPMVLDIPVVGKFVNAATFSVGLRLFFMGFQIPILALTLNMCCCAVSNVSFMETFVVIVIFNTIMSTFVAGGICFGGATWYIKRHSEETELKWAVRIKKFGLLCLVISFGLSFISGLIIMFGGIATIDGDTFSGAEPNFGAVSSLTALLVILVQALW